jgi:hypothetical protein
MSSGVLIVRIILVLLFVFTCVSLWRYEAHRRAGLETPLLKAFCQDFGVPLTEPALRLVDRYLRRTYRFRHTWTWIGIAASFAISFTWKQPPPQTGVGLNIYPPTSNLVLMGLGFWFIGLVRSELYNVRPRYHGSRVASLEVREVRRYLPTRMLLLPRVVAALAVTIVVIDRVLPHPSPHSSTIVGLGLIAVVALLVTEACQQGIAHRTRPAITPDLVAADEAIRRMAAWSVAYGAAGLITLLGAFEAVLVALQEPGGTILSSTYNSGLGIATTDYAPREIFVWFGIILFAGAVLLALQAGRMVRPEPRTQGRAAAMSR